MVGHSLVDEVAGDFNDMCALVVDLKLARETKAVRPNYTTDLEMDLHWICGLEQHQGPKESRYYRHYPAADTDIILLRGQTLACCRYRHYPAAGTDTSLLQGQTLACCRDRH